METYLEVENLTKWFGKNRGVCNLRFKILKGEIYGLLGPNGCGKTTTLNLILSLIEPTEGNITLYGGDSLEEKLKLFGVSLGASGFLNELNAFENLKVVALIKNVGDSEIHKALRIVNLPTDKKKYKSFSYGMKQRLSIASALLGNPEILIFDEPTNGLDPIGISELRSIIKTLNDEGKTIIIASHQLDEIEKLCSYLIFLNNGEIVKQGMTASILEKFDSLENAFIKLIKG